MIWPSEVYCVASGAHTCRRQSLARSACRSRCRWPSRRASTGSTRKPSARLNAAAVIGLTFSRDLLETLGIDAVLVDLVDSELIDQITFTGDPRMCSTIR